MYCTTNNFRLVVKSPCAAHFLSKKCIIVQKISHFKMNKFNLSTVERDFVLKAISERKRIDGREAFEYRELNINLGVERGCCIVDLGRTKVMAQVSCEISAPKDSRPTEGILFVNVELSPMAAPYFESGRQSEMSATVNRLLERCLKESGCVDLESLCIQSGLKVWVIRIDLHVLNNDGNMVDALSVAAMTALNHFRRPDVNVCGEDVTVLGTGERDPLPITLHHLPVCVTFAFFEEGKYILLDPTETEEHVMDGTLVICMNRHKELCLLQTTGNVSVLKEQISRCKEICFRNVCDVTERIHAELQKDANSRTPGSSRVGLAVPTPKTPARTAAADTGRRDNAVKDKAPSMPKPSEFVQIDDDDDDDLDDFVNLMDEADLTRVVQIDSDVEEDLIMTVGKTAVQTLPGGGAQATSQDVMVVAKKSKKKKKKAKNQ